MGPRTKRSDGGHARPSGRIHERRLINFTAVQKKGQLVDIHGQLVDIRGQLVDIRGPLPRSTGRHMWSTGLNRFGLPSGTT